MFIIERKKFVLITQNSTVHANTTVLEKTVSLSICLLCFYNAHTYNIDRDYQYITHIYTFSF